MPLDKRLHHDFMVQWTSSEWQFTKAGELMQCRHMTSFNMTQWNINKQHLSFDATGAPVQEQSVEPDSRTPAGSGTEWEVLYVHTKGDSAKSRGSMLTLTKGRGAFHMNQAKQIQMLVCNKRATGASVRKTSLVSLQEPQVLRRSMPRHFKETGRLMGLYDIVIIFH